MLAEGEADVLGSCCRDCSRVCIRFTAQQTAGEIYSFFSVSETQQLLPQSQNICTF
jgi:hypothetical protein